MAITAQSTLKAKKTATAITTFVGCNHLWVEFDNETELKFDKDDFVSWCIDKLETDDFQYDSHDHLGRSFTAINDIGLFEHFGKDLETVNKFIRSKPNAIV